MDIFPKELFIEVSGYERASYWVEANDKKMKVKFNKTMYEFKGSCFVFEGPLIKGDHFLAFEFDLPQELPSSMWFKENSYAQRPHAKVLHSVKAILLMEEDQPAMEYKQFLVVQQPPHEY